MSFLINELFSVRGKTAIVTGGSRGIGRMIAEGYVQNGVKTYITARKSGACIATAEQLAEQGECIAIPADLSIKDGGEAFIKQVEERESKIDILVNNAGAAWGAPFEDYPDDGYDKVMNINQLLKRNQNLNRRIGKDYIGHEVVAEIIDTKDDEFKMNIGKRVIVAGLDRDYKSIPFKSMANLLAHAEKITKLSSICIVCGDYAYFSQRLTDHKTQILVGETDEYEARCRKCFKP